MHLSLRLAPRVAGIFVMALAVAASADNKPVTRYSIEDFLATTNMRGADFSPDGRKILVSSDRSGIYNAYAVPVDGGEPVALTHSTTDAILAEAWYPKDERFIYVSDRGGNELNHVYVQAPDGSVRDATPGDSLKAMFTGWAFDEQSFFVQTNERDRRYFDLYEVDPETLQRKLVYQNDTGYELADISRDERWLAFGKINGEHDSDVYLYDRQKSTMQLLTSHQGQVVWEAAEFAPDGHSLYLITNEGREFAALVKQDLTSGERTAVEQPDWDVSNATFSHSGKYLVVAINNDARTEIRVYDAATHTAVKLPKLPDGDLTSVRFDDRDTHMAFYLNGSRAPSNLFVSDLGGGKSRQLTQNLSPKIDPRDLVDAEVVRFASYDGVQIPGLLYKPKDAGASAKVPALVYVHGGPGGQTRLGYSGLIQYLVNHGYAVYGINNRGSSGYGKTFFKLDDRKHGEADLDDCVTSKALLVKTGWVDPARIGILGGSYGGYMVLAAMAFRPQEFAVGVDLFGVANWVRTLESIPKWWESQRQALYEEMGDPATDGEYLKRISPLFHAGNIQRPLLVLQGANDPRVLKVESDEMVAAAKANGATVEYLTFDDEGHGFRNKKNQLTGYSAILEFCDKYLAAPAQIGKR
jgi:dipeptidyl aminopeptidase/acylaminoacyl peptidase